MCIIARLECVAQEQWRVGSITENVAPIVVKKLYACHAKSEETLASVKLTLGNDTHTDAILPEINVAKDVIAETESAIKATRQQLGQSIAKPHSKGNTKAKGKAKGKAKAKSRAKEETAQDAD